MGGGIRTCDFHRMRTTPATESPCFIESLMCMDRRNWFISQGITKGKTEGGRTASSESFCFRHPVDPSIILRRASRHWGVLLGLKDGTVLKESDPWSSSASSYQILFPHTSTKIAKTRASPVPDANARPCARHDTMCWNGRRRGLAGPLSGKSLCNLSVATWKWPEPGDQSRWSRSSQRNGASVHCLHSYRRSCIVRLPSDPGQAKPSPAGVADGVPGTRKPGERSSEPRGLSQPRPSWKSAPSRYTTST